MAERAAYTACMTPYMKGGGPDRKLRFCAGAKVCSGKAKGVKEAEQMCKDQPAKEAKPRKSRGGKAVDPVKLAACVVDYLGGRSTSENLQTRLEQGITQCLTPKQSGTTRPPSYKRFMNTCLKETGGRGNLVTAQADIKTCQTKWNETRGA